MAEADSKKLLADLRVVDLKVELEKREIDTSGVKAVLVKKLHKALLDEGHDPDTYVFQIEKGPSTPMKQNTKKKDPEEGQENDNEEKPCEKEVASAEKDVISKEVKEAHDEKNEEKPSKKEVASAEKDVISKEVKEPHAEKKTEKEPVSEEAKKTAEHPEKNLVDKMEEKEEVTKKEDKAEEVDANKTEHEVEKESKVVKEDGVEREILLEKKGSVIIESIEEVETAEKSVLNKVEPMETETNYKSEDIEEKTKHIDKEAENDTEKVTIKDEDIYKEEEEEEPKDYEEGEDVDEGEDVEHHDEDSKAAYEKNDNDLNGLDNEDSINLTLGEEDEKLMAGEVDLLTKDGKDLKERGVSRLTSSKKGGSGQDQQRKSDVRITSPEKAADDKDKKSNHRNLWVSGLSSITRATDLKHLFTKHGKVVAAKVVTNAKTPGARCYGFVTMGTIEDAQKCISSLNLTELHGRLISVEAVANRPTAGAKKPVEDRKKIDERKRLDEKRRAEERRRADDKRRNEEKRKIEISPRRNDEKRRKRTDSETLVPPGTEDMADENGDANEQDKALQVEEGSEVEGGGESTRGVESDHRSRSSRDKSRERKRSSSPGRRGHHGVLSFSQIKEERDRARATERARAAREEERRRRERHRAIERKQRDEAMRLEREREKIRLERERLERERAELLRLERERLEREKEDLKRQQLKLEEARRNKRTLSSSRDGYEDRKRVATESSRRYEAVHMSPPRAEYKKDSRREALSPGRGRYEEATRTSRREEPPARVKDSRGYSERNSAAGNSATFRARDERDRREETGHRLKSDSSRGSHREAPGSKGDRYTAEGWGSGVGKNFGSVSGGGSGRDWNMSQDRKPEMSPWARPPAQSDRWVSNSSTMMVSGRSGGPSHLYPPGMAPIPSSMGMQIGSGYQQGDRFDAYKPMGSAQRKY